MLKKNISQKKMILKFEDDLMKALMTSEVILYLIKIRYINIYIFYQNRLRNEYAKKKKAKISESRSFLVRYRRFYFLKIVFCNFGLNILAESISSWVLFLWCHQTLTSFPATLRNSNTNLKIKLSPITLRYNNPRSNLWFIDNSRNHYDEIRTIHQ